MRRGQSPLRLLVVACVCGLARPQAVGAIDWEAYLTRHDPVWSWNNSAAKCKTGYTDLPQTIGSAPGACAAVPCSSAEACLEESASACDACESCVAFSLSPKWHNASLGQFFATPFSSLPNPDWTTWTKGGDVLRNHSSCTLPHVALAWEDSAFIGNGLVGALLRVDERAPTSTLLLDVGRTDVWDRRAPGSPFATGNMMFDRPRLPVGVLRLACAGNITAGHFRVHLHNATVTGALKTTLGSVAFSLYVHYARLPLLLQWNATGGEAPNPATGAGGLVISLTPTPGNSTRGSPPPTYRDNPLPVCAGGAWGSGEPLVCEQPLLAGAGYATALLTAPWGGATPGAYATALHIANDWPANTSSATAAAAVQTILADTGTPAGWASVLGEHAAWWAAYWPQSFLTLPDTRMEATYVLQVRPLHGWACICLISSSSPVPSPPSDVQVCLRGSPGRPRHRPHGPVVGAVGPVTYWAPYTAGRWGIADTLRDWIYAHWGTLADNPNNTAVSARAAAAAEETLGLGGLSSYDVISPYVPSAHGAMVGTFPWLTHNLYMHAAQSGNDTGLATDVWRAIRGAVQVYLDIAWKDAAGTVHLPATYSPEYPYPPPGPTNDTNFDLTLFSWGLRTLLDLNTRFAKADPQAPLWESALSHLTAFPASPVNGYNVSLGVGFNTPHRHFSHLFAMYPLHLLPWSELDGGTPVTRKLFAESLDRWTGLTCVGGNCPNGFTFVGAASMSALMGDDDSRRQAAVGNISNFITSGFMHAATLYSEGHQPCFESPPGIASSIQELLLQSWGGRVRPFPAVPASWPAAAFANLTAEGGLRVSAVRANGATAWVGLSAAAVAPSTPSANVTLALPDAARPLAVFPSGAVVLHELTGGDVWFTLPQGTTVVIASAGSLPPFVVEPLPGNASQYNYWGMHE